MKPALQKVSQAPKGKRGSHRNVQSYKAKWAQRKKSLMPAKCSSQHRRMQSPPKEPGLRRLLRRNSRCERRLRTHNGFERFECHFFVLAAATDADGADHLADRKS